MLPFTLHQLRVLKTIVNEENFTRAAEALYLSQPSLSKQIRNLEKNLGVSIINRTNNKISLTENGKIILHYSERILALCEESCRALNGLKNNRRGKIVIGISQTINPHLIPHLSVVFAQNYNQVNLKIQTNSTKSLIKNLITQKLSLAIVESEITNNLKDTLIVENFIVDELNLIISRMHPFAQKTKIKKEHLYCLNFITLRSDLAMKGVVDNVLIKNGIEIHQLKTILKLNSIEGVKTAVSLGLGAAFLSSSILEKELQLETLKILKIENIEIKRKLSLISTLKSSKSRAVKVFYGEIRRLKSKL